MAVPKGGNSLHEARKYNADLAADGQYIMGEAVDPFLTNGGGSEVNEEVASTSESDAKYQALLNPGGDHIMGSIKIPKISVDLPIYHGTTAEALEKGAGHLYGSSLPVGGKNTHAVLTGHRGLVSSLMFTRLDEMRIGDAFYISIMGETYGYKVDRISVIDPQDTSKLKIEKGEDRVTLLTCTPYGVNTQRLIVSAVRASIPLGVPDNTNIFDWWQIAAVIAGLMLGWLAFALTWIHHRARWHHMMHASERKGY